jgi:hypothetical protein
MQRAMYLIETREPHRKHAIRLISSTEIVTACGAKYEIESAPFDITCDACNGAEFKGLAGDGTVPSFKIHGVSDE